MTALLATGTALSKRSESGPETAGGGPGLRWAPAFVAVSILLYLPTILNVGLLLDDIGHVPHHADGKFAEKLRGVWTPTAGRYLRPLPNSSFIGEVAVFGDRPWVSHAHNAAAHGLNSFLVARLASALLCPATLAAPMLAGILFLVWPTHHEAVSWIVGRYDVYFAMFILVALCAYMPSRISWPRAAAGIAAFACALLSKETAVVFPAVFAAVLALEWRRTRRKWTAIAAFLGFAIVEAAYLTWRWGVIGAVDLGDDNSGRFYAAGPDGELGERFVNFMTESNPLGRVMFGFNTTLVTPVVAVFSVWLIAAVLLLGALRPGTSLLRPRVLAAALVLFAIGLFPAFGFLIQNDLEGCRYLYLPVAGIAVAVAALFARDDISHAVGARGFWARIGLAGPVLCLVFAGLQLNNSRAWIRASETVRDVTAGVVAFVPQLPANPNKINVLGGRSLDRVNGAMTLGGRIQETVYRSTGRFWHSSVSVLPSGLRYLDVTGGSVFAWDETARTIEPAMLKMTPAGFLLETLPPAAPPTFASEGIRSLEPLTPNAWAGPGLREYKVTYTDGAQGYRIEAPLRKIKGFARPLPAVPGPVARLRGKIRSPRSPFQSVAVGVVDETEVAVELVRVHTGRQWTSFEFTWEPRANIPYQFFLVPDGLHFETIDLREVEVGEGLFWTARKPVV